MQQYYIPSARELSRLVGVCKAPVIQHFIETILGATTIRSFDEESRFRDVMSNRGKTVISCISYINIFYVLGLTYQTLKHFHSKQQT